MATRSLMTSPSDKPDLERIEKLFQEAADLPQHERGAFLDGACGADVELRSRLDAMLARLDSGDSLAPPALGGAGGGGAGETAPVTEQPGAVIDRYKLLQVIGEGGFGVVYMAEQLEPVQRKVALKIIKLGMDTKEVVARFEAERQALAMMDHPHIAKVLDAGATATGRPYFVMELVRGVSITEYCDTNRLTPSARLRLFEQVCHAVQHAHQKGVIHRDIKPSNVLVTLHDGTPVPKVIDFGIVKAMHTRLTEKTLFTEFRRFLGTPAYMSPEQAEMSGLDIDTRTDIYALGVLLYELLVGSTPFDTTELMRSGLGEMQRVIREKPPERPSMRISTRGDASIAAQRGVDLKELGKGLRGDLDWIVMKTLEKDRARRYGTASELAADVRRHLACEPVSAGPPSAVYRFRKYVARNRNLVGLVAAFLIVMVVFVAGIVSGMREAARQRDVAQQQTEYARDTIAFLTETLALADPTVALAPDVTVRSLLDRAADRVADSFADNPLGEARVRSTIGRAYASIGVDAAAEQHLRRAVQLIDGLPAFDSSEFYAALWSLTGTLFRLNRDDAYSIAFRARSVGHAHIGESHPELADELERFLVLVQESDLDGADRLFAALCERADRELEDGDPLWPMVADSLMAAGFSMWYAPQEERSTPYLRKALELRRRALPTIHPDIGESLGQLVGVLNRSGHADEAEAEIRRAVALLESLLPEDHWYRGFARSMLGECLTQQGSFAEAEVELLAAHEVLGALWDENDFYGYDSLVRIVRLYDAWGKPRRAAEHRARLRSSRLTQKFQLPWAITGLLFGPDLAELGAGMTRLQALCGGPFGGPPQPPDPQALQAAVDDVVRRCRQDLAADDRLGSVVARNLVGWAANLPRSLPGRAAMVAESARLLEPHADVATLAYAEALALQSEDEQERGGAEAAVRHARRAADLLRGARTIDTWVTANSRVRIARVLLAQRLFGEAEELAKPAHATLEAQFGSAHKATRAARRLLFEIYRAWGKPDEARRHAPSPDQSPDQSRERGR